jgi:hypothetical protein
MLLSPQITIIHIFLLLPLSNTTIHLARVHFDVSTGTLHLEYNHRQERSSDKDTNHNTRNGTPRETATATATIASLADFRTDEKTIHALDWIRAFKFPKGHGTAMGAAKEDTRLARRRFRGRGKESRFRIQLSQRSVIIRNTGTLELGGWTQVEDFLEDGVSAVADVGNVVQEAVAVVFAT